MALKKKSAKQPFGLGNILTKDERDGNFPLRAALPTAPIYLKRSRYWSATGYWGNQGNKPHCVGYSCVHFLEDAPVTQKGIAPIIKPDWLYKEAQKVDEWQGESYDGTSVRAAMKILQREGFIKEYYWGRTLLELTLCVCNLSPVVVGTEWFEGMFFPDAKGFIKVTGQSAGGHAYLINGCDIDKKILRIKNSWGKEWGKNGHAYITFDDFDKLIKLDGEICLATELQKIVK